MPWSVKNPIRSRLENSSGQRTVTVMMSTRMQVPLELEMGCMYTMSLAKIADGTWSSLKNQAEWESQAGKLLASWTPEQKADVFKRIVAACI
jgi:hypothetical protein